MTIYWLDRYSIYLGFIMSKNMKGFVILYSNQKFIMQPLTFFWHNKTLKERVSIKWMNCQYQMRNKWMVPLLFFDHKSWLEVREDTSSCQNFPAKIGSLVLLRIFPPPILSSARLKSRWPTSVLAMYPWICWEKATTIKRANITTFKNEWNYCYDNSKEKF